MSNTIDRFRHRDGSFFVHGANKEGISDLGDFLVAREMDYEVKKVPVYVPEEKGEGFVRVPNQFEIRRLRDDAIVSPGSVTKTYGEMGPLDMLTQLAPFVKDGFAKPDSAFMLDEGRVECIALRLDAPEFDAMAAKLGEKYRGYLVARNAHGRESASASVFLEREICVNGMTALESSTAFSLPHRGDTRKKFVQHFKRWEELRAIISRLTNTLSIFQDTPMTLGEAETVVNKILKLKLNGTELVNATDGRVMSTQKRNLRMAILDAFNMPSYGTHGGSVSDLYHGVTWVGSHWTSERSTMTTEGITEQLLTGSRGVREQRALAALDAFVANKLQK